ncbi:MAG: hypothetical protein AVDCRST_MAG67-3983 [uncultured Solirubrobacteraceae bacterium]|uniref:Uncharacterized protein n=1 Tax=uncultured Solirubrobacteraceae bacterium TaxID=1162706 RepID=A0A6J4TQN0_9ACTN|nr:MAG: hypothetical protein AVDCRST_MAG67-3983 [uncultured Solirubrobacteraceae bacterium]
MRRSRTVFCVVAALALGLVVALLTSGGSSAAPTKSQALFKKTLLADDKTTAAVKELLRERGGIVAPDITFADLTGDGRSDAVVLVDTRGVAGAVALYVFSTHGAAEESDLRAVYRSQRLYRADAEVADATLIVRTPRFREGDDICCPAKIVRRVYVWSAGKETLRLRRTDEVDGPS